MTSAKKKNSHTGASKGHFFHSLPWSILRFLPGYYTTPAPMTNHVNDMTVMANVPKRKPSVWRSIDVVPAEQPGQLHSNSSVSEAKFNASACETKRNCFVGPGKLWKGGAGGQGWAFHRVDSTYLTAACMAEGDTCQNRTCRPR